MSTRLIPPSVVASAIWVCYPTADEATYGWGDPYPGPVPPLGTPQTSWDISKHVGALMNDDGTLASLASNDVATPQDWRVASPSKVVVSWTAQAIYAAGAQVLTDVGIRCAALKSMQDGGTAKTYLLWIGLSTSPLSFVLRAREVSVAESTGVVTVTGATTYQWALSSNVSSVGLQGVFWGISADASKVAFTHIATRTSYEATDVPTDISSTATLQVAVAFQDGATQFSYTNSSVYSGSRKYLIRSDYVGNALTPVWLTLAYGSGDVIRDTVVAPLSPDICYRYYNVDFSRYEWTWASDPSVGLVVDPIDIVYREEGPEQLLTATLLIGSTEVADEVLFRHSDFQSYYATNGSRDGIVDPYPETAPQDATLLISYFGEGPGVSECGSDAVCATDPQPDVQQQCRPFLLDPAWQDARFSRVVYEHFGENDDVGSGFHCGSDPLTTYDFELRIAGDIARVVNFGGDYGSFTAFDPVTTPPQTQGEAQTYLDALYAKLVTPANGTPSYGVSATFLHLDNGSLVYCIGASNNDDSGNWEWQSYLDDVELTANIGISGYTDPKILYESSGAPQWSFGITRQS